MRTSTAQLRTRIGALATTTTLVLGGVAATMVPAHADVPAPALSFAHVASKGVGLKWNTVTGAGYRVRFSSSSSMSSPDTWDTLDNYFEWTRTDANPTVSASRLTPGKTYYFQVKAISKAASTGDRTDLSKYSIAKAVTLPTDALAELEPVDLTTSPGGANTMYVSWRSRGPGVSYVLRYTDDPSLDNVLTWKSVVFNTAGGAVTGLDPGTKYRFRSRVIDSNGVGISPYSDPGVSATTTATTPSPGLSVLSYNIRKAAPGTNWSGRRGPVAANITASQPDVLGLQEATPLRDGTAGDLKQYDDIVKLLGEDKYELVTREGSSGTKLVYNKDRLKVEDADAVLLTTLGSSPRYAEWAILKDLKSNKTFFAINTHLEPGSNTSSTYNNARIKQANEVRGLINTKAGGRPVVILGDMNSSRVATPNNGQYRTFTGDDYTDPLDNPTSSWAAGANATAEHLLDGEYNSYNNVENKARRTSYPVGTNVDYIYVSPGVRVATWRTVVRVGTSGSFIGTIPSDHNLLATTIILP